ncbi:MAG TPA: kinase [Luteibacter sp.]|uniref:kinase n=1 Tax=Luteibacter sp. TaxID=1886636 RepID=UPI002B96807B|nr:kinase [Luteibacter sp.]HVI55360.1 kinase [Luteibacter sp.]
MESADAITLAERVLGRFAAPIAHASKPFILGLSGLQGSGKSTLATAMIDAARDRGWSAATLSLDDVYLTRAERQTLGRQVHPLLSTRGVPGTHDLALLASTLDALDKAAYERPVSMPRFDKGHDDRYAEPLWPEVPQPPMLVILEGWCLGLDPQAEAALAEPINALERDEDADGVWRRWVNAKLAEYLPVWRRLDALVLLQAPSWEVVARWRDQAEWSLRARGEPQAMNKDEMARFLQHYERLSKHALDTLPAKADMIVTLDRDRHRIG